MLKTMVEAFIDGMYWRLIGRIFCGNVSGGSTSSQVLKKLIEVEVKLFT
jgi:hypothetical protein